MRGGVSVVLPRCGALYGVPLPCSSRHSAYLPQFRLTTPPVTVRSPVMVTFPLMSMPLGRDGQVHAAVGCPQVRDPAGWPDMSCRRCGCRPQRQHHPRCAGARCWGLPPRSSNNGVTVPVQVDHHADVPGLVDRTDDKAAPVDGSHGDGQDRRLGLECVFVGIAGDRLNIDGQALIKGKDLYTSATQRPAASACFLASS